VTGERAKRCVEPAQKYLGGARAARCDRRALPFRPLDLGAMANCSTTPSSPIGRITKVTRTRAANPRITTARRGRGRFPIFARRWRARGIFHRHGGGARAYLGSHGTIAERGLSRQVPKYWMATRHMHNAAATPGVGVTEALRVWNG